MIIVLLGQNVSLILITTDVSVFYDVKYHGSQIVPGLWYNKVENIRKEIKNTKRANGINIAQNK